MDYKLAKQLKAAGYPQPDWENMFYVGSAPPDKDFAYTPTLSELISACGDGFQDLRHGAWVDDDTFDHDKWAASTRTHDCDCDDPDRKDSKFHVNWEYAVGDSPEEAVAKLWLEMKEKGEIQDK